MFSLIKKRLCKLEIILFGRIGIISGDRNLEAGLEFDRGRGKFSDIAHIDDVRTMSLCEFRLIFQ